MNYSKKKIFKKQNKTKKGGSLMLFERDFKQVFNPCYKRPMPINDINFIFDSHVFKHLDTFYEYNLQTIYDNKCVKIRDNPLPTFSFKRDWDKWCQLLFKLLTFMNVHYRNLTNKSLTLDHNNNYTFSALYPPDPNYSIMIWFKRPTNKTQSFNGFQYHNIIRLISIFRIETTTNNRVYIDNSLDIETKYLTNSISCPPGRTPRQSALLSIPLTTNTPDEYEDLLKLRLADETIDSLVDSFKRDLLRLQIKIKLTTKEINMLNSIITINKITNFKDLLDFLTSTNDDETYKFLINIDNYVTYNKIKLYVKNKIKQIKLSTTKIKTMKEKIKNKTKRLPLRYHNKPITRSKLRPTSSKKDKIDEDEEEEEEEEEEEQILQDKIKQKEEEQILQDKIKQKEEEQILQDRIEEQILREDMNRVNEDIREALQDATEEEKEQLESIIKTGQKIYSSVPSKYSKSPEDMYNIDSKSYHTPEHVKINMKKYIKKILKDLKQIKDNQNKRRAILHRQEQLKQEKQSKATNIIERFQLFETTKRVTTSEKVILFIENTYPDIYTILKGRGTFDMSIDKLIKDLNDYKKITHDKEIISDIIKLYRQLQKGF